MSIAVDEAAHLIADFNSAFSNWKLVLTFYQLWMIGIYLLRKDAYENYSDEEGSDAKGKGIDPDVLKFPKYAVIFGGYLMNPYHCLAETLEIAERATREYELAAHEYESKGERRLQFVGRDYVDWTYG